MQNNQLSQANLKVIRQNHLKMSQKELGARLGYTRAYVSLVENNKKPLSSRYWSAFKRFSQANIKGDASAILRSVEGK